METIWANPKYTKAPKSAANNKQKHSNASHVYLGTSYYLIICLLEVIFHEISRLDILPNEVTQKIQSIIIFSLDIQVYTANFLIIPVLSYY